ncbi:MAG TPA: FtsX-like permease family protein [Holophagaceae bacterium]|nr:FtsX-like permease family protein [Holophagaceae bacterium]
MKGPLGRNLVGRALRWEWGRALLALLSIALGVAVFLAIRLANRAAIASFESYAQGAGLGAAWVIRSESGGFPEEKLAALEPLRGPAELHPVLEGAFTRRDQEPFQLLGLDLVEEGPRFLGRRAPAKDAKGLVQGMSTLLGPVQNPEIVWITERLAREEGYRLGSVLEGWVDDRLVRFQVGAFIPESPESRPLARNVILLDLPALQAHLHRPGQIDRVELYCRPGTAPEALREQALRLLPPGLAVEPAELRISAGSGLSEAYRFNLTLMSVVSLVVGAFLLFQAFDAAVYRRRETWATLRALGASSGLIQRLVLKEAFVIGALGSATGVGLGWVLAQTAVQVVSRTLRLHYGLSNATSADLLPEEALTAFAVGLGACLLAAWIPARKASFTPPIPLLKRGAESLPIRWKPLVLTGLAMVLTGLALPTFLRLSPGTSWHAYLGAALVLVGGSLASIAILPWLGKSGRTAHDWIWKLRLRPLQYPTARHAFTVAALAVAVGMAAGVGIMVRSFERTLDAWITASHQADLYVSPLGSAGASAHRLSPERVKALAADPAVAATDSYQRIPVLLQGRTSYLGSHDFEVLAPRGAFLMSRGGAPQDVLNRIHADGLQDPGALISESFAATFNTRLHQEISLPTPQGPRVVRVRGIFKDYGTEHGSILVDRPVFQAWFGDDRPAGLALFLKAGESVPFQARRLALANPGLKVQTQAENREQGRDLFRKTFGITYALEFIALLVALVGLIQAVLSLSLARRSELWTLRALGATEREIAQILLGEGLGMATAGLGGGLLLGGLMAHILVNQLQPLKFGWSLNFRVPWVLFAAFCLLSLAVAGLAILPATRWGSRLKVDREAEEGA